MIKIAHLYYDLMNLYGDNGNIKAMKYQLENQGIKTQIEFLTIGDSINFDKYDIVYIGPGTEGNQKLILKDLLKYKEDIVRYIDDNKFFIVTGNSLELFGKYIITANKKKIKGLNIFDFYCEEESFRLVDEVIVKNKYLNEYILGFQNQNSTMKSLEEPLFDIVKGIGAFPGSKHEGVVKNNFYGTYIIGPILARNPELLKSFIKKVINKKFDNFKFKSFDLKIEQKAHDEYINNYYSNIK